MRSVLPVSRVKLRARKWRTRVSFTRETDPPRHGNRFHKNPGQPGFRVSGVRKIAVLAQAGYPRTLLRSQLPRSTVMRDPPK